MKTLYIMRHAKSSWAQQGMRDHQRPLNERGRKDAPEMGRRLKASGISLDRVLSSDAQRTRETIAGLEEGYGSLEVYFTEALYLSSPDTMLDLASKQEDSVDHLMILAHNPGITELINQIPDVRLDNAPTSALAAIRLPIAHWSDLSLQDAKLLFFDYPKKINK